MGGEKAARDSHKEEERKGGVKQKRRPRGPLASERGLYLHICGGAPEFLVTPLLMGPVCLHLARAGLKSQSAPREPTAEGLLEQKGLQLMPESVDE